MTDVQDAALKLVDGVAQWTKHTQPQRWAASAVHPKGKGKGVKDNTSFISGAMCGCYLGR